jgi:O-methyltransferase
VLNIVTKLIPGTIKDKIRSVIRPGSIDIAIRFVCWNYVPGDYLEFGCYSGVTFSHAYQMFQTTRKELIDRLSGKDKEIYQEAKPRFFAFDSFEGLPEAQEVDDNPYLPKHWKKSSFSMSQKQFEKTLHRKGISGDDVIIVKGWYNDTLTDDTKKQYNLRRASVVHIDCNYYESAILALNFITDLINDGTVIVFDDYNFFRGSPKYGQRAAFLEWLSKNPHIKATELTTHDWQSAAFFLNMKR